MAFCFRPEPDPKFTRIDQREKVGFEVEPKSVSNMLTSDDHKTCKISQGHEFQEIKPSTNQVTFSYSVNWEKSETRWASRWDMYLEVKELFRLRICKVSDRESQSTNVGGVWL